ncbi:unnamed protein product [Alopecurus aequalis]
MSKRPRDEPPSSSLASVQKRQLVRGGGDSGCDYEEQQAYSEERQYARRVADHYSARRNQTVEEREKSPIIHLKRLNNWIKTVLIHLHTRPGDSVLDLACGKGGDLIKWDKARAGYYVGVDIAQGSIRDCMARYNADRFRFPARLICADCYDDTPLHEYLSEDVPFDVCSCQFAMHYSWSTEARARQALANVSALLRPGGAFIGTMPDANVIIKRLRESEAMELGNSVYHIAFGEEYAEKKFPASRAFGIKYRFRLEDAVDDCPEWVVPFHVFRLLAEEYDLELVLVKNFHEFVHKYSWKPEFGHLVQRIGTLSQDEWEVSYLYLAFVFRKRGPSQRRVRNGKRPGKTFLAEEDIEFLSR